MKSRNAFGINCLLFTLLLLSYTLAFQHSRALHANLPSEYKANVEVTNNLSPPPAHESEPWVYTGGPVGGLGYDVRMVPENPDIMYVTDALSGVFKSIDGGKTWTAKNKGITTRMGPSGDAIPVFSLTIDPNDSRRIWAGTQYNSDAYLSVDGGDSWTAYTNGIAEEFLSIRGFTVEPGNSDVVYFAAEVSSWEWNGEPLPGLGLDMVKGVVYKTTNGGQKWNKVWEGDNLARYIWIHPENHNLLYVSTGIFDREAANSDPNGPDPGGVGILRSTDGGQTWETLGETHGLDADELYIGSLYMHPTKPNILLAAAGNDPYSLPLQKPLGGIYRTEDGGDTWTEVLGPINFSAVEICEGKPDVAYAAGLGGFYRSKDAGLTWTKMAGQAWGPPGIIAGFPIDIQCDPRDADRLFVNNYGGGNYLSIDGGRTWTESSRGYSGGIMRDIAVVRNNPSRVYATARSGVFTSRDGGGRWIGLNYGVARWMEMVPLGLDPADPQHLLIANLDYGAVPIESKDGGATWAFVQTGLNLPPPHALIRLIFAPNNPQLIYGSVGSEGCLVNGICHEGGYGLIVSRDGGVSWERSLKSDKTILGLAIFAQDSRTAYAAEVDGGLYRTGDSGRTWELVNASPGPPVVDPDAPPVLSTLAIDPYNVEKLYAGYRRGSVRISVDGGTTWGGSPAGIPPEAHVVALAVDSSDPDVVYAGAVNSGVFVSLDGGSTWRLLNDGLNNRAVLALSLAADGTVLYAAIDGGGVYRLGRPRQINYLPLVTRR